MQIAEADNCFNNGLTQEFHVPPIRDWIKFYSSNNPEVKLRSARGLIQRFDEAPLPILIDILVSLSGRGILASAVKAIRRRRDPEIVPKMISLLDSKDSDVREAACEILGNFGDKQATAQLLRMVDDPYIKV